MEDVYFKDRVDAGKRLADKLTKYKDENPVVLALPRGGVVLGRVIAEKLNCPLDLIITRKIGHPDNSEYAIGAVTVSGEAIFNDEEISRVDKDWLENEKTVQVEEAKRRQEAYLKGRIQTDLKGKTAVIVDDGIATGLTMRAAVQEVRAGSPDKIVVAVPVMPEDIYKKLQTEVDDIIAIYVTDHFLGSVGAYYQNFPQVSDAEVTTLLGAH